MILKGLIGLILTFVLLVVIILAAIAVFVDPNDYKQDIVALVKQNTGRDIVLQEPINLSLFPWLGIETGGVTLGNAPGFGETPFARIERLALKLKLVPLLSQNIEVDTLSLQGLQVNLVRNAQGQTNWADLIRHNPTPDAASTATSSSSPAFSVQQIDIRNANLSWYDQVSGQHYQLQDFNLSSEGLAAGASAPVQASLKLRSADPATDIQLELQTVLTISADYQRYTLDNLQLIATAEGQELPADGIQLTLGAGMALDLAQQHLQVSDLQLDGPAFSAQGQITLNDWATNLRAAGQLQLAKTNLKRLLDVFEIPIQTKEPQALTNIEADLTLSYADNKLHLAPLQLTLDNTKMQGELQANFADVKPLLKAKLHIDQFNLDDYLPPATEVTAATSPANIPTSTDTTNPFQVLQDFALQAELRIAQLQAIQAQLSDVQLNLDNQQGLLTLKPIQASLYSGMFNGDVTVDARRAPVSIQVDKQLTGIQIGPLLHDVIGQDHVEGRGDLQIDTRFEGMDEGAIRKSLTGSAAFQFTDGAYKGVNLAALIQGAAGILGLDFGKPSSTDEQRTDFAMLKGSVQIDQGVIHNRDLQLQSPLLRITGQGTIDLAADHVDYVLTTKLVKSLTGQGGKTASQLKGIPIPIRITGPLSDLSYQPDLSGWVQASLQQRIQQEQDKVLNNVQDKVKQKATELLGNPNGLGDALQGLKGLFGR